MNAQQKVVKVCKKHGELNIKDIYINTKGHNRCRLCQRQYAHSISAKKARLKYEKSSKCKESLKKYRKSAACRRYMNKYQATEKYKEYCKKISFRYKERIKKYNKEYLKELRSGYIKSRLRRGGISNENITPGLVRIKRLFLKAKRLINQEKKHVNQKQ